MRTATVRSNRLFGSGWAYRLDRAAAAQRDHRRAARLRFDRDDAEVLFTREEQRPAAAQVVADDGVGLPAEELDRRPGQRPQPPRVLAVADHEQLSTEP